MKQGSHIMLQRLVRSTVSTEPRPYRTVLEPCLCMSSSLCAGMSRPGKFCSIQFRNLASMAIMSSYLPWIGHSFTIRTSPSRSIICALISPTFSCIRSRQSFFPSNIASRASLTQPGHNESVCRGQPSVGFDFSHDFSSGLSDHFGVNDGFGLYLLKKWIVSNATPAVLQRTWSIAFHARVPRVCGIFTILHTAIRIKNDTLNRTGALSRLIRPLNSDQTTYSFFWRPAKPFPACSLTVTFGNVYPDAPKGVWKGLNGVFMQPMGALETSTHYDVSPRLWYKDSPFSYPQKDVKWHLSGRKCYAMDMQKISVCSAL